MNILNFFRRKKPEPPPRPIIGSPNPAPRRLEAPTPQTKVTRRVRTPPPVTRVTDEIIGGPAAEDPIVAAVLLQAMSTGQTVVVPDTTTWTPDPSPSSCDTGSSYDSGSSSYDSGGSCDSGGSDGGGGGGGSD